MAGKMYRIEVVGNDARMEAIRTAADLASLKLNEQSFGEVESAIQRKLNAMDSADSTYWCVAVFPDDVVYRVSRRLPESPSGTPVRSTECMYRVNYSVSAEGEVTFTGEPVEVRLEKTYVPVEQAGNREPTVLSAPATGSPTEGQERETEMAKKDLIDELIGCECTRFKANDRAFLETMTEDQLGLLRPVDPPPAAAATPPEVKVNEEPAAKPEVKPEPPAPKVLSADEYVAQAPPEVAGILRRALDAEKAEKAEIVKQLMANESNPFPQADLEKRDLGELKALAALGRVNVRFTGRGGGAPPEPPKRPGPPRMPSIFEAKTA